MLVRVQSKPSSKGGCFPKRARPEAIYSSYTTAICQQSQFLFVQVQRVILLSYILVTFNALEHESVQASTYLMAAFKEMRLNVHMRTLVRAAGTKKKNFCS